MRALFAIGLFATSLIAADKVRLAPKWKAKERVSVKLVEVSGQIDAGKDKELVMGTRTIEYVQTTTATKKGLPVRAKRKFNVHEMDLIFEDAPKKHELSGRELTFVSQHGLLYTEKAPALMSMGAGGDWTWMLPSKAVSVGDTWVVKRALHLMPMGTLFMAADTACRLASLDGDTAVIKFTQSKEPNTLVGTAEFSLKAGRVLKASFKSRSKAPRATYTTAFTYSLSILPEKK